MGRKKIRPDFDKETLGMNPFVAGNFEILVVEAKNKRRFADVTEKLENPDEIITNLGEMTYTSLLEYNAYCKVFTQSALKLHIGNLPTRAKALFLWLQYELKPSEDFLFINAERYCIEFGAVLNTYNGALNDLIDAGVLALTRVNKVYWVNPLFLFSGNRLKKYPDKIKIK